ncbi:MAG TPA: potassium channel family protein [Pyrinomonadaceae bacterium]|jgi:F0F1-type ATP synthase membrane subunit c/vacuolar-type H+-ATPase subunit K
MGVVVAILGCILIVIILWDAFEAIILPRRVSRRITIMRLVLVGSWTLLSKLARAMRPGKARERYLGFFGPLSLILLLCVWGIGLIVGFAMIHWGIGSRISLTAGVSSFRTDLYFSGTTFLTLGLGDMVPLTPLARAVTVIEAGVGFGFLAIVIGYLPVIYSSFSRREINISLLDARAGSPPSAAELLIRHGRDRSMQQLEELLREWERWAAELLESHLSYPVLAFFRSQHENQSWLAGLTTILDVSTLLIVGIKDAPSWQAKLTFAMSRHALVDLAQVFNTPPIAPEPDRLPPFDVVRMRRSLAAAGLVLRDDEEAERKLIELRRMYEPYVNAMSGYMFMRMPHWIPPAEVIDNWQTSAWERNPNAFASSPAEARLASADSLEASTYEPLPFDLFY